ncbi:hypothetical protein [Paraburkholderia sp.]|uniref:hypothetical protein n=1 Tax=Paraburkholderia sp. TaxID=1926495 RepID=UPI0039E59D42
MPSKQRFSSAAKSRAPASRPSFQEKADGVISAVKFISLAVSDSRHIVKSGIASGQFEAALLQLAGAPRTPVRTLRSFARSGVK